MSKEKIVNLPNALSAYRLLAIPFIVWAILKGDKHLFITLLSVNLITDILDGIIARAFKLETALGARLDSLADIGSYLLAVLGLLILEREFVNEHETAFKIIIVLYFIPQIISLFRFRKTLSLHLYSSKVLGYVQGIFMFTYFFFGYSAWYFYFMIIVSCLSYCEEMIIVSFIPQLKSNVKSLYFILKENKLIR